MIAGQEFDMIISTRVLNRQLKQNGDEIIEVTAEGERPLPSYSREIGAAWEVVRNMGITLIPVQGQSWFALVGPSLGWESPAKFIECIQKADFAHAGAAVSESAPLSICLAALSATEKRISELTGTPSAISKLN